MNKRYTLLLAAGCFSLAAQAAEKRPETLETVEVFGRRIEGLGLGQSTGTGSRLDLSPLLTPASIEVLAGDVIRQRGDLSIVESVTRATGITSEGTPGDGGTALSARGFAGHSSIMYLLDGTRLFVGAGTVTFPFDSWSVERIEVLHGPASVGSRRITAGRTGTIGPEFWATPVTTARSSRPTCTRSPMSRRAQCASFTWTAWRSRRLSRVTERSACWMQGRVSVSC